MSIELELHKKPLLVGVKWADAAIYRLALEIAFVHTLDFFCTISVLCEKADLLMENLPEKRARAL